MLVSIWRPVMLYPLFTEAGKEGDIAFVLQICWGRARVNIDWRFHLRPTHQNFKQFVRMISISTTHQTNQTLSLSFNLVALVGLLKMCCRGWMSTWLCTCGRAKELIFPQQGGVIQRKQMGNQSGLTKALYDCKRKQDPGLAKKRERERDFCCFLSGHSQKMLLFLFHAQGWSTKMVLENSYCYLFPGQPWVTLG